MKIIKDQAKKLMRDHEFAKYIINTKTYNKDEFESKAKDVLRKVPVSKRKLYENVLKEIANNYDKLHQNFSAKRTTYKLLGGKPNVKKLVKYGHTNLVNAVFSFVSNPTSDNQKKLNTLLNNFTIVNEHASKILRNRLNTIVQFSAKNVYGLADNLLKTFAEEGWVKDPDAGRVYQDKFGSLWSSNKPDATIVKESADGKDDPRNFKKDTDVESNDATMDEGEMNDALGMEDTGGDNDLGLDSDMDLGDDSDLGLENDNDLGLDSGLGEEGGDTDMDLSDDELFSEDSDDLDFDLDLDEENSSDDDLDFNLDDDDSNSNDDSNDDLFGDDLFGDDSTTEESGDDSFDGMSLDSDNGSTVPKESLDKALDIISNLADKIVK